MKLSSCVYCLSATYCLSMVSVEATGQSSRLYNSAEDVEGVLSDLNNDDTNVRRRLGKTGGSKSGSKGLSKGRSKGRNKGGSKGRSKGRSNGGGSNGGSSNGGGSNGGGSNGGKSYTCQQHQPHFVEAVFKAFPGFGTQFVPSTLHRLLEPGATAALYETPLTGFATYYDGDQATEFPITGQLTGSCIVVDQQPPFDFNANGTLTIPESVRYTNVCTVCLTYFDECILPVFRRGLLEKGGECNHPAYGSVTAAGNLFSHWQFNSDVNPYDFTLLGSEAHFAVTGGFYDLYGAVSGGWFNFIHDGEWHLELRVPMTQEAACELQEYAKETFYKTSF